MLVDKSCSSAGFSLPRGSAVPLWLNPFIRVSLACPARPARKLVQAPWVPSAFLTAARNVSLGFFCLFFSSQQTSFCSVGKRANRSPSFPTPVIPAQKLRIYANALRNHVQYCITRGTLEMSLLL